MTRHCVKSELGELWPARKALHCSCRRIKFMTPRPKNGDTSTRYAPDSGHLRGSIMCLTHALRAPAGRSRQVEVSLKRSIRLPSPRLYGSVQGRQSLVFLRVPLIHSPLAGGLIENCPLVSQVWLLRSWFPTPRRVSRVTPMQGYRYGLWLGLHRSEVVWYSGATRRSWKLLGKPNGSERRIHHIFHSGLLRDHRNHFFVNSCFDFLMKNFWIC